MEQRQYLPTFADLIDRLSICMLKSIFIPENREAYKEEIELIKADLDLIMSNKQDFHISHLEFSTMIEATMMIMLSNRFIWENEGKVRNGEDANLHLLKITHSINGIRNQAKNIISVEMGERVDLKVDCLADNLPKEIGNWNYFQKQKTN